MIFVFFIFKSIMLIDGILTNDIKQTTSDMYIHYNLYALPILPRGIHLILIVDIHHHCWCQEIITFFVSLYR